MPSTSNSASDPYTYPDSTVLVNLADIRDQEQVERFEAKVVYFRLVDLMLQPITGKFDIEHLKAIHRYLFQDVYAWAGQFRTVDISKGSTPFGFHQFVEQHLSQVLKGLTQERVLVGADRKKLIERVAFCMTEINAAHPFREGNGRTQREFVRQLAFHAGYMLAWGDVDRAELYVASGAGMRGDLAPLITILTAITSKLS